MTPLSHLNEQGKVRMVDVSAKEITARRATAEGFVRCAPALLAAIRDNTLKKGDLLAVARLAGILAAKKTSDLIPLCHPLPLHHIGVEAVVEKDGIRLLATAATEGKTGVEMEALIAVSIAALTVIDMGKSVDSAMTIESIRLIEKTGGKQDFRRGTP